MHELLKHVLNERDLTRAGDIFAIPDSEIVNDLNEVLKQITEISSRPDYCRNDRDQALIEICVTRVTSCIKETGTLEKYCGALVSLLESCLHHNLMPLGHLRDDDPPHAKIASDIIACIVLVSFPVQEEKENYGNKTVMELFLPVAVQFLHKGNREISRHMARYLTLAAVHHSGLLKPHVQTIMDSIMSGNYPLVGILTSLYAECPAPLEAHGTALVSLLPHAEAAERSALFALLEAIAGRRADALRPCVPHLLSYLCPHTAPPDHPGCMCVDIMQVIVSVSRRRAQVVSEHVAGIRRGARGPHAPARARALAAAALAALARARPELAQEALNFVLEQLQQQTDRGEQAALRREATALCRAHPALFTDRVLNAVRGIPNHQSTETSHGEVNRTSGGVTIVKLGGAQPPAPAPATSSAPAPATPSAPAPAPAYTRRAKLGDSRSTGRLHPGPNSVRSMTRLNVAGGSVGGLHKSMTRLSSSHQINSQQNVNAPPTGSKPAGAPRPAARTLHHNILIGPNNTSSVSCAASQSISVGATTRSSDALAPPPASQAPPPASQTTPPASQAPPPAPLSSSVSVQHSNPALGHVSVISNNTNSPAIISTGASGGRRNHTSVTVLNAGAGHRISVFEPYPMRDTVQHFCEKHLDKIKAYMDNVSLTLPPPAKCTIEERRSKKQARLSFACGRRGPHCLYARALFCVRTRAPRIWIHLMFLALQARHSSALSSRDPTVASLKHCWDILKCENKTFLTLVTSAFPGIKEQETVAKELVCAGLFDVFEAAGGGAWACRLCAAPERAQGFLAASPVIEGQLREKKGRWRLFQRWRTRYFTLSAAHLSCKGASGGESIDINQIRSVKVSRGARNIPKAFEIFTGDQTLILKPKDGKNAEEWAQCLSIAVAHSHALAPAKANSLPARGLTLKGF